MASTSQRGMFGANTYLCWHIPPNEQPPELDIRIHIGALGVDATWRVPLKNLRALYRKHSWTSFRPAAETVLSATNHVTGTPPAFTDLGERAQRQVYRALQRYHQMHRD